jgi:hypothetical protein
MEITREGKISRVAKINKCMHVGNEIIISICERRKFDFQ